MTRILLVVASIALLAQAPPPSAGDRYHEGAQAYVGGDNARALEAVNAGLALEPDDARLQALRDLIQQDQQEQDQQDGGQQDQDQQNSDPGESDEQSDESESGEGDSQNDSEEQSEQDAQPDQTNTAPQEPSSGEGGETAPVEAGEMTEAQAQRLLDAVGGEEQLLLRELRRAPTRQRRSDKDW